MIWVTFWSICAPCLSRSWTTTRLLSRTACRESKYQNPNMGESFSKIKIQIWEKAFQISKSKYERKLFKVQNPNMREIQYQNPNMRESFSNIKIQIWEKLFKYQNPNMKESKYQNPNQEKKNKRKLIKYQNPNILFLKNRLQRNPISKSKYVLSKCEHWEELRMMKLEDELQEWSGRTQSSVMEPRPGGQVGQRLHWHLCHSTKGPPRSSSLLLLLLYMWIWIKAGWHKNDNILCVYNWCGDVVCVVRDWTEAINGYWADPGPR